MRKNWRLIIFLAILLIGFGETVEAQKTRSRVAPGDCASMPGLNGVFRINVDESDRLYSVIEGATSKVPYRDQQQFFIDLAVRLTPPDLLTIECRGNRVSLGSSRSPRVEFIADGNVRSARAANGQFVRSRILFERDGLTFSSNGGGDNLNFKFTPLDSGNRLRVTRRIAAQELIEPVIITTVYEKIGDLTRWDIFDKSLADEQFAKQTAEPKTVVTEQKSSIKSVKQTPRAEYDDADILKSRLESWIEATNRRDLEEQMSFYMPVLKAFYLARNAPQSLVRDEKNRVFASARVIDINAEQPEIIFQDNGRTAIMRFRKKYNVVNGARSRSGEVIQELRWQKADGDWKIFSERDIRVLR